MGIFALLADAMEYPRPGGLDNLEAHRRALQGSPFDKPLQGFFQAIKKLELSEWEEEYTRTFDLSPAVAPYVGFQVWGESYERGNFMALVSRELQALQIDPGSELPDHLAPVFRYLDAAAVPHAEIVQALRPALQRMAEILNKNQAKNPYSALLQTAVLASNELPVKS
ncbi:MAG: hypothetical protein B6D39_01315 [Anaerolineae bacterium UTCFX2]|jgi:nitrate reductase delta subunit|nr:molecular chaperone TorD family protein [Anaerolineales bacterium]OQY94583.1 MAG: hypothetical protein B6D39_01315 [Anaerolineae bacterium UTCFX2]